MDERIGYFTLTADVVVDEWVRAIMATVTVVYARYNASRDVFEYLALSPLFDPVPEGTHTPRYFFEFGTGLLGEVELRGALRLPDAIGVREGLETGLPGVLRGTAIEATTRARLRRARSA